MNPRLRRILIGDFTLKRLVHSTLLIAILVYTAMFLYAWLYSDRLIFRPRPSSYGDSDRVIKLAAGDGATVAAVYLRNPGARYTILYSHGNAEDIGELLPTIESLRDLGFSVFAYDYRGYGMSPGVPSEENVYHDEKMACDYLVKNAGVPEDRIIAFGRSLGGGAAVDLASKRPLGGLVVESSFVTAFRVVTHIPLFPFDKFRNISKIGRVHCPVLVMHGTSDEVIPFWHGQKLFEAANEPKLSLWVKGGAHSDLFEVAGDRYRQALRDFVALIDRTGPHTAAQ